MSVISNDMIKRVLLIYFNCCILKNIWKRRNYLGCPCIFTEWWNYFMFVASAIYVLFACPFLIDCCTWLNYLQTKFSECDVSRRISPLRMLCTNTKLSMNDPWYKEWFTETRLSNLNARIPRISTTRRLFRKYTGYISWEFPRTPIGRLIVLR